MKKYSFLLALLLLVGMTSCYGPMPENNNIPYASVYFTIDCSLSGSDNLLREGNTGVSKIYDTKHPAINTTYGQYGYSGVVVTRAIDDHLYAFDLCCPYEAKKEIKLQLDGFFLKCPKCGSTFEIGNGYGVPNQGPATQPLKIYKVQRYSNEMYRVSN